MSYRSTGPGAGLAAYNQDGDHPISSSVAREGRGRNLLRLASRPELFLIRDRDRDLVLALLVQALALRVSCS